MPWPRLAPYLTELAPLLSPILLAVATAKMEDQQQQQQQQQQYGDEPTQTKPKSSDSFQATPAPLLRTCERCRIRKVKCDGGRPKCRHCTRHKTECLYRPAQRRRAKRRQELSLAIDSALDRQQQQQQQQSLPDVPRESPPTVPSLPADAATSSPTSPTTTTAITTTTVGSTTTNIITNPAGTTMISSPHYFPVTSSLTSSNSGCCGTIQSSQPIPANPSSSLPQLSNVPLHYHNQYKQPMPPPSAAAAKSMHHSSLLHPETTPSPPPPSLPPPPSSPPPLPQRHPQQDALIAYYFDNVQPIKCAVVHKHYFLAQYRANRASPFLIAAILLLTIASPVHSPSTADTTTTQACAKDNNDPLLHVYYKYALDYIRYIEQQQQHYQRHASAPASIPPTTAGPWSYPVIHAAIDDANALTVLAIYEASSTLMVRSHHHTALALRILLEFLRSHYSYAEHCDPTEVPISRQWRWSCGCREFWFTQEALIRAVWNSYTYHVCVSFGLGQYVDFGSQLPRLPTDDWLYLGATVELAVDTLPPQPSSPPQSVLPAAAAIGEHRPNCNCRTLAGFTVICPQYRDGSSGLSPPSSSPSSQSPRPRQKCDGFATAMARLARIAHGINNLVVSVLSSTCDNSESTTKPHTKYPSIHEFLDHEMQLAQWHAELPPHFYPQNTYGDSTNFPTSVPNPSHHQHHYHHHQHHRANIGERLLLHILFHQIRLNLWKIAILIYTHKSPLAFYQYDDLQIYRDCHIPLTVSSPTSSSHGLCSLVSLSTLYRAPPSMPSLPPADPDSQNRWLYEFGLSNTTDSIRKLVFCLHQGRSICNHAYSHHLWIMYAAMTTSGILADMAHSADLGTVRFALDGLFEIISYLRVMMRRPICHVALLRALSPLLSPQFTVNPALLALMPTAPPVVTEHDNQADPFPPNHVVHLMAYRLNVSVYELLLPLLAVIHPIDIAPNSRWFFLRGLAHKYWETKRSARASELARVHSHGFLYTDNDQLSRLFQHLPPLWWMELGLNSIPTYNSFRGGKGIQE